MGNTQTNVHFYNGVDYILPEVFGSSVECNGDKYTVSSRQMDYLIEHILGMLRTTKCYSDRAEQLNNTLAVFRKVIAKIEFEPNRERSDDNEERLKEANERIEHLEGNLGAMTRYHREDLEALAKCRKEIDSLKENKSNIESLSEAEINLLNILRNNGACTIIINKWEDRDVWDANKLKNA